jgi:transposase
MTKQSNTAAMDRPGSGSAERSPVERSEAGRSGVDPDPGRRAEGGASNETLERPRRRSFTAEYKQRILREADAAAGVPGAIGALLRREGLYSSHLGKWREERAAGQLAGLSPKRRGPARQGRGEDKKRLAQLERENERLRHRLRQAETIIEFQKKLHELLGTTPESPPGHDENSR